MKEKMALLISFIDKQWKVIDELSDKISGIIISMKRETLREEYIVYAAYTLHNIYCAFEDIFKNVALTFENQINDLSKYHLELLKKMSLSVYKIRPQFLSDESYRVLNEIRMFRHVFRHAYDYKLDGEKILSLAELMLNSIEMIQKDKDDFRKFLIEAVESD